MNEGEQEEHKESEEAGPDESRPEMEPHCGRCVHVRMCTIFLTQKNLVRDYYIGRGEEPYKPYEVAKICRFFQEAE